MRLFRTPPGQLSWGQRLDLATAWSEEPIALPALAPPSRDGLATAYPKRVPEWTYWALLALAALAVPAMIVCGVTSL